MSDYTRAFAISASGMALERLRLEVAATNLANANATKLNGGRPYQPERVVAAPANRFDEMLSDNASPLALRGVGAVEVQTVNVAPRVQQDAGNPQADAQGLVSMPAINPVEEMVTVMSSVRAFEADVRALDAARTMALKALAIGSNNS
jgi:flagellar basal-body rod protein FlgC